MNNISDKAFKSPLLIFVMILLSLAIYLCKIGGYGSDEDTLPMIGTFETILSTGKYMSSRFTGYPVAEIIIGFFSFFFGSFYINILIFFSFFLSLIIIYASFEKKFHFENKLYLFLVLSLSNPVLFFDNLEPIDYSLALLFFSLGIYFFRYKKFQLSVLFFAICIGTRINFAIFIISFIFLNDLEFKKYFIKEKFFIALNSIFFGCLFYTPIWFSSKFSLSWLTAARPTDQGILGLSARYFYKLWLTFGNYSFFLLIFIIFLLLTKKKKIIKKNLTYIGIIISNLLLFFYIPAELSYLQPCLIFLYLLLIKNIEKKFIYSIIFLNFFSWAIKFDIVKIKYKFDLGETCKNITREAVDVDFSLYIKEGSFNNFIKTRNTVICYSNDEINSERYNKIKNGKALRPGN